MHGPELILISNEKPVVDRLTDIAGEFEYNSRALPSVDDFVSEDVMYAQTAFVVLSALSVTSKQDIAGMIQVVKQTAPDAYIMAVLSSRVTPEESSFMKKSGANVVLLEDEFLHSSKAEFILTQILRTKYLPVKAADIQVGAQIECNVYHLMPLNKKYIPVLVAGQQLSETKKAKMGQINEVYIRKESVEQYQKYTETIADDTNESLSRRCRAQFLNMCASFTRLILLLSDQGEHASYHEGRILYDKCLSLATELLNTLSSVGEPWDIINNSSIGEFGSVERAPAIAAYAGLLSLETSIGKPEDCMIAAMMADVGMLILSPKINKKLRAQKVAELSAEEVAEYEKHPIFGLNQCLSRKVPIPDNVKNIILCTHERADGKGFPHRPQAEKIPDEAMIIQLCEVIDNTAAIRMGQSRPDIIKIRREIFEQEQLKIGRFSPHFMSRLRPYLLKS